jgi:hypothetical protein
MKECKYWSVLAIVIIFLYVFVATPISIWYDIKWSVKPTIINTKVVKTKATKKVGLSNDLGFLGGWVCEPNGGKLNCMVR